MGAVIITKLHAS